MGNFETLDLVRAGYVANRFKHGKGILRLAS